MILINARTILSLRKTTTRTNPTHSIRRPLSFLANNHIQLLLPKQQTKSLSSNRFLLPTLFQRNCSQSQQKSVNTPIVGSPLPEVDQLASDYGEQGENSAEDEKILRDMKEKSDEQEEEGEESSRGAP